MHEQKFDYKVPVPDDVPAVIRKMMKIPDKVNITSAWHVKQSDEEICLTQESQNSEVVYGDRMKVKNTFAFSENAGTGDVTLRQFVEVIWINPLPWTHRAVTSFVEKKAAEEACKTAADMARIFKEAASSTQLRCATAPLLG